MKRLLIVSTSKIHGSAYMEYIREEVLDFFSGVKTLTFIPYARPGGISHDGYTDIVREALGPFGMEIKGLHEYDNPKEAVTNAEGLFTGGGNTFQLVKTLYELDLMDAISNAVNGGVPYMGSSAGSNITGLSMRTTNDMPIVYPPSFDTLCLVPFNINPHYLDPDPNSKHQGETRETRIKEFHHFNDQLVVGLREGSWLRVEGEDIQLKGEHSARIFEKGKDPWEMPPGEFGL
ncbi:MAG: dipeptidase PepE [Schleiferiaceae bacterium]